MTTQPVNGRISDLLDNGDFLRLWWAGFGLFLIRWLEILVFGIFTYQQTRSTLMVAAMTMVRLVPMALFGAVFGAVAERIVRRNALILIVVISLVTSTVIFLIAWYGQLQVWHLLVASFINGVAWTADNPVRRTAIGEVVGPRLLSRAMAVEVGSSNASRLAGPGLGGLLMSQHDMLGPLAFAVVVYLLVLVPCLAVRYRNEIPPGPHPSALRGVLRSIDMFRGEPRLVGIMWMTMMFNLFAWPVLSMVPVFGEDQLGLDPAGIGLLASSDGLGALLGAVVLTMLVRPARYGQIYTGGVVLFLAMIPLLAYATHPAQAALALLLIGFGQACFAVMQSTLTYVVAPPGMRSQAMGFMTMSIGVGPIGFLAIGQLADRFGAPHTAAMSAVTGLIVMLITWPWWRAMWRNKAPQPAERPT